MPARSAPTKLDTLIERAESDQDTTLADALCAFRKLSRARRRSLVQEIVLTRADELQKAYSSIRSVAAGYRRRAAQHGETETTSLNEVITDEPVVVFQVHQKWKQDPKSAEAMKKRLPTHLLTFGTDPKIDQRILYAVPTDVTQVRRAGCPESAADNGKMIRVVSLEDPDTRSTISVGVVSFAVRVNAKLYACGCHHVFARSLADGRQGRVAEGRIDVEWPASGSTSKYARTDKRWLGRIRPGSAGFSIDAALAKVPDTAEGRWRLGRVLGSLDAVDTLEPTDLLHERAIALTDQNGRVRLGSPELVTRCNEINYFRRNSDRPVHAQLIRWRQLGPRFTKEGDSGSPVVSIGDGPRLLFGLHLGSKKSNGIRYAFTLPVYYTLNPVEYGRATNNKIKYLPKGKL